MRRDGKKRLPAFGLTAALVIAGTVATAARATDDEFAGCGLPAAKHKLVQEIDCARENKDLLFLDDPAGASQVVTILGTACRVLSNKEGDAKYFAYSLNENEMTVGNGDILGYFVCDVERTGPHCMLAEARAVAHGDPFYLGSLTGNTNNRGFPRYVRRFHAAFLALPALPSEVVAHAASDAEVVVRAIRTEEHGTYVAVVNTGFETKRNVSVKLPATGTVQDAVTGEDLPAPGAVLTVTLEPAELRTLRIH